MINKLVKPEGKQVHRGGPFLKKRKIFSIIPLPYRLEQKIKDLETQLDDEQRRLVDAQKSQRRTERRIKELTFSQDEDHKNHERMQELVDKLQNKVKSYKKQIEEAEEIAALNLAKFRKVQADLEQAEERADINEQVLARYKAKGRGASVAPM